MASDKSPSEDPRLVFNLPGTWFPVAITDEGASEQDVERMVQGIVGPADDAAVLRRQMHDQVVDACAAAAEGGAVAMYFGKELEKDAPFPVNITVYQPPGLRMSPAIGTESDEVFGILRMGFDDADDTFVDVEGGNYRALRRLLIEKDDSFQIEVPEEETPEEAALRAEAEKLSIRADARRLLGARARHEADRDRLLRNADGHDQEPHARALRSAHRSVLLRSGSADEVDPSPRPQLRPRRRPQTNPKKQPPTNSHPGTADDALSAVGRASWSLEGFSRCRDEANNREPLPDHNYHPTRRNTS